MLSVNLNLDSDFCSKIKFESYSTPYILKPLYHSLPNGTTLTLLLTNESPLIEDAETATLRAVFVSLIYVCT